MTTEKTLKNRKRRKRKKEKSRQKDHETFADRAIESEMDKAMGIPNDDIEWLTQ